MANEYLYDAMRDAGLVVEDFADRVGVDVKTARRWLGEARVPHPRTRNRIVAVLGVAEHQLWPDIPAPNRGQPYADLRGVHVNDDAPDWRQLAADADQFIDLYGLTLADTITSAQDVDLLGGCARAGARVRVMLSAADSFYLLTHQSPGEALADQVAHTTALLQPLLDENLIELRRFVAPADYTIVRLDSQLLIRLHLAGPPASASPVLHVAHQTDPGLFDRFRDHFDALWASQDPPPGS